MNTDGWVGGDPATPDDDPSGIQGAFYLYGDELQCCQAGSCELFNPCSTGSCCWTGNTVLDGSYAAWGCGIGMELNSTGGDAPVKSPYAGTASCFAIAMSGDSGGQKVRIGFTQYQDTTGLVSPFIELANITGSYSGTVFFTDVACPSWDTEGKCSITQENFDLQIQVVGGEGPATFNLCVDSIVPS